MSQYSCTVEWPRHKEQAKPHRSLQKLKHVDIHLHKKSSNPNSLIIQVRLGQLSCVTESFGTEVSHQCWSHFATECKLLSKVKHKFPARLLALHSHTSQPHRPAKRPEKPTCPCFPSDKPLPGDCTTLSPSTHSAISLCPPSVQDKPHLHGCT